MKILYAIRSGNVIKVLPLRGKLFCPASKIDTIFERNGALYAGEELLIGQANLFYTEEEAVAELQKRNKATLIKQQKDDEAMQKLCEERERLIEKLMCLADSRNLDVTGIGFATNEQIEWSIWKLQNLTDEELTQMK